MYRLFLAIRYLLTRPINLLGMGGIAISVWALVVVVSLFSGVMAVIERHVQEAGADIMVTGLPDWTEWTRLESALGDDANVAATAPRLLHFGLLLRPGERPPTPPLPGRSALHGGDQPFLFVLGVEPTREAEATEFDAWLVNDAIPPELRVADLTAPLADRDGTPTVLIGLDRMLREGYSVGDRLRLTTAKLEPSADGGKTPVRLELDLVVGGAYRTQHGGFTGNNVFVAYSTLQRLLFPDRSDPVQEVAIRVHDPSQLDATADRLQRAVHRAVERDGLGYGLVETWRERNAQMLANVAHQRTLLKIVLVVIMVVAAFLMLATLSMTVTEKIADIGILTAMGGTPGGVTMVFLASGMVITIAGLAIGLSTGVLTSIYLEEIRQGVLWAFGVDLFRLDTYNLTRVPYQIEPLWLVQVTLMALVTGLIVSAIPALRAARHDPLVSLRGV